MIYFSFIGANIPIQRGRFSVTTHPPLNLLSIDADRLEKLTNMSNYPRVCLNYILKLIFWRKIKARLMHFLIKYSTLIHLYISILGNGKSFQK